MFAAHRSRCNLTRLPSLRASRRAGTALGLLLGVSPACSADRFNSTQNAALSDDVRRDAAVDTMEANGSDAPRSDAPRSDTSGSDTLAVGASSDDLRPTNAGAFTSDDSLTETSTLGRSAATGSTALETAADDASSSTASDGTSTEATSRDSSYATTAASGTSMAATTHDETSLPLEASTTDAPLSLDFPSAGMDGGVDASADGGSNPVSTSTERDAATTDHTATDSLVDSSPTSDDGTSVTAASTTGETSAPPLVCTATRTLPGVVRDFPENHPDMEPCDDVDCRSEKGLLETALGGDGKPVLSDTRKTDSTVQSAETFNQWFNDVEGVNVAVPFALRMTQRFLPQRLVFDSANPPAGSPAGFSVSPRGFFPIDELNQTTRPHNYSFTYEVSSFIEYTGGETLTVRGDDDIFVFINDQLVVDLGGIHLPQEAIVRLDDLGLAPGNYAFRLFFAERHVEQSNLYLSTTARFMDCTSG